MNRFTRAVAMASARHPWRTIGELGARPGAPSSSSPPAAAAASPTTSRHPAARANAPCSCSTRTSPRPPRATPSSSSRRRDGTTLADQQAEVAAVLEDVARPRPRRVGRRPVRGRHHLRRTAGSGTPSSRSTSPSARWASLRSPCSPDAVSGIDVRGLRVELGGDAVFLNAEDEQLRPCRHRPPGRPARPARRLRHRGAAVLPIGALARRGRRRHRRITLLAGRMDVSVSAIPVAGLVGLGVGVDYALFVVARYRENRDGRPGQPRAPWPTRWAPPAPRCVFAGGTVVVATAALAITGLGVLTSIGLATALMVLSRSPRPSRCCLPCSACSATASTRAAWCAATVRRRRPRRPRGGASATASPPAPGPT